MQIRQENTINIEFIDKIIDRSIGICYNAHINNYGGKNAIYARSERNAMREKRS